MNCLNGTYHSIHYQPKARKWHSNTTWQIINYDWFYPKTKHFLPANFHLQSENLCANRIDGVRKNSLSDVCFLLHQEFHYDDIIMNTMASPITSLTSVYSSVYSGADRRKHHGSASLASVRGIHRWAVNSPHKNPVTRKMCSFEDVIM